MVDSDFIAWAALRLLSILPAGMMAERMFGTPASVLRHADPGERVRVSRTLEHL
jgi:hypothetical protein